MNRVSSWEITSPLSLMTGYAFGSRHMTMRVSMRITALNPQQLNRVCHWLRESVGISPDIPQRQNNAEQSLDVFLNILYQFQQAQGFPLCESGIHQALPSGEVRLFIPVHRGAFALLANLFQCVVQIFNEVLQGKISAQMAGELKNISTAMQRFAPATGNIRSFMAAAFAEGIPLQRLPGMAILYGQGTRGRLLDSSLTDRTPGIACQQARNKPVASEILRVYGLPVQAHKVADNIPAALAAAETIGYPVVVKPVDLDRGEGVAADLRTPQQVKEACQTALSLSKHLMIEKHFYGRDYRITVLDGRVIWCVERVPGGVTGDGVSTITQLTDQLNRDPERSDNSYSPLKILQLDDEALTLLAQEGMTTESVPSAGQFIRLRRISNITRGGVPVAVTDQIHPDNRRLAERAAAVLRLDFAGVDLLIPDIRKSWRESGAAICEVNAQPTIGNYTAAHLYGEILRHMLQGNGRIPLILVGGKNSGEYARDIGRALAAAGYSSGVYDGQDITINGEHAEALAADVFTAGRLLVMDPSVGAVVLALTDASVAERGLPFQRYDVLVTDSAFAAENQALLDMILPACDGRIQSLNGHADFHGLAAGVVVSEASAFHAEDVVALLQDCPGLDVS